MKRLLLTFSILFSIAQIQAQVVFNRAYHDLSEAANPFLININSELYFTTQGRDASNFENCFLYKYDATGVLKFRSTVLGFNVADKAFVSFDNNLIVVGHNSLCDVITPSANFISKIDANGTVLFNSVYSVEFQGFPYNDRPRTALQYSDSSYFTFTDSLLIKHSKTGQFISKTNLGLSEISSALLLSNGAILLSAIHTGSNSLVTLTANGLISSTTAFPKLLNKMVYYDNAQKIMGLAADGKIYKISPSFGLIGNSSFSNNAVVNDFVCQADTIYSIFSTSSDSSNYRMCDTSFTDISHSSTTTHSFTQNAICLSNRQVNILATGIAARNSFNNSSHTFASLSKLNKFASNNFQNDLKVLSVNVDSTYTSCYPYIFQPGTNICTPYLRAKVLVKNVGSTTINHFKLNCFEVPSVACGIYYFQESISNLNLIPGDSITITTIGFARSWNGPQTTSSFVAEFCFYTTLPNGETDKTIEDNEACNTFNFQVTSLKENSSLEQFITIAPNPFNSDLFIEADSEILAVSVYNTLGQVIKTQEGNAKKISLDNSDLQNGVYFLHIETGKGKVIKKVLKN
jgi:hypothetical protein